MKKQIIGSLSVIFLVLVLIEPSFKLINGGRFFVYEESLLVPIFFSSAFLLGCSIYLLFFNQTIQQAWWRWARFALLVPVAFIFILLPSYSGGGGFITFGGTTDLVILWGVVFAAATIIHTLYHRFYLKIDVDSQA